MTNSQGSARTSIKMLLTLWDSFVKPRNLSYQTMENDLREYFSEARVVSSLNLMIDQVTGKSPGFAFVEFASAEEASKAVELFRNREFQGRALTVNVVRLREERPPRWSGRGPGEPRSETR